MEFRIITNPVLVSDLIYLKDKHQGIQFRLSAWYRNTGGSTQKLILGEYTWDDWQNALNDWETAAEDFLCNKKNLGEMRKVTLSIVSNPSTYFMIIRQKQFIR